MSVAVCLTNCQYGLEIYGKMDIFATGQTQMCVINIDFVWFVIWVVVEINKSRRKSGKCWILGDWYHGWVLVYYGRVAVVSGVSLYVIVSVKRGWASTGPWMEPSPGPRQLQVLSGVASTGHVLRTSLPARWCEWTWASLSANQTWPFRPLTNERWVLMRCCMHGCVGRPASSC